jgi:predicted nucleic acid-binding protein
MATTENPVFIDTNILIYANLAMSPFHLQATERLQALDEQRVDLWISRQILREYLSGMTRQADLRCVSEAKRDRVYRIYPKLPEPPSVPNSNQ